MFDEEKNWKMKLKSIGAYLMNKCTINDIALNIGSGMTPLHSNMEFWNSSDYPGLKLSNLVLFKYMILKNIFLKLQLNRQQLNYGLLKQYLLLCTARAKLEAKFQL